MYSVDFSELMFIIDIMDLCLIICKIPEGNMICSLLFHILNIQKTRKTAVCLFLLTLAAAVSVFCVSAPAVSAEKETRSPSIDSVNLRENQWVYSVYTDKNNMQYAAITRYDGKETDIELPAEIGGFPVKVISREAFCNSRYITSVVIPENVSEIGKYAFSGCIGLSSVTFPSSLRNVREGAFYGCRSLTEAGFYVEEIHGDGLTAVARAARCETPWHLISARSCELACVQYAAPARSRESEAPRRFSLR